MSDQSSITYSRHLNSDGEGKTPNQRYSTRLDLVKKDSVLSNDRSCES